MLTPPILGWLCPKGQVTRAQEAEENYLVKRELATVKQQSEEAGAELEQAKKVIRQLQQQQQPNAVRRAPAFLTRGRAAAEVQQERRLVHRDGDVPAVRVFRAVMTPLSPLLQLTGTERFYSLSLTRHSFPFTPTQIMAFVTFHTGFGVISTLQRMTPFWGHTTPAQFSHHSQPGASWEMQPFISQSWGGGVASHC